MSHQTGIRANDELLKIFSKSKEGKIRAIKISIVNEELAAGGYHNVKSDWETDFDKMVLPFIEDAVPCYILYRLDATTSLGFAWLLISWNPENASVRHKMLYASTKATLKQEFGSAHIKDEIHATVKDEATISGYHKHKAIHRTPAPLTTHEEELAQLRKHETHTDYSTDSRQPTLSGISIPMTEEAVTGIRNLAMGSCNYLQYKIDITEEKIHLVKSANVDLLALQSEVPEKNARYHIYCFKHTHEGDYLESFIFIYSMPGYSCSIKERMMYSSCKAPFLESIANLGLVISKKIEIDTGSELTEEFFQEELHPKKILHRPQFAKPKGPPNRGAKRMTRPNIAE